MGEWVGLEVAPAAGSQGCLSMFQQVMGHSRGDSPVGLQPV